MNPTGKILARVPLFRHCLQDEIGQLQKLGKSAMINRGHLFDLKKVNSLNVVVDGIFEIESAGKTDVVYLASGSFFGAVPFTENRQSGKVRALVDSTLIIFSIEDLYRFFLMSYKCLRGYLKIVGRLGFEVSESGSRYFGSSTRIIMIYSSIPGSGKSFLASLCAASLKRSGKTVVLDMSFSGNSVFNFFGKKAAAPLSHRMEDGPAFEGIINERLERVDQSLDLINVAFGSKVKVNVEILSPLLFMLSKEYRYVVIDCGDEDPDLRNRLFALSDGIFTVMKTRNDARAMFDVFDSFIQEGQRVYYLLNERFAGEAKDVVGGMVLPDFRDPSSAGNEFQNLEKFASSDAFAPLASLFKKKRSALVLETGLLSSIFYGGFLDALHENGKEFDVMYASAYGYIVLALHLLSGGGKEFRKRIEHFFSPERVGKLLDITFPTGHVFKNGVVSKLAADICGDARIEMYHELPTAMLGRNGTGTRRLFSTGYLRDMTAASFCLYPIFEQVDISGGSFNAGYPDYRVRVEDMLRNDIDETAYISVYNSGQIGYPDGKLISFFTRYLDCAEDRGGDDNAGDLSDSRLILEVSEREVRIDRMLESSRGLSEGLIKKFAG